jgi:hypothetical protein
MLVGTLAWSSGLVAAAPASAQTTTAPVAAPAAANGEVKKDKSVKTDKSAAGMPDAALLDYLGRYGDAADGLDPLGLAEGDAGAADGAPPRKEQQ